MGERVTLALNDYQVALLTKDGDSQAALTIFQEDILDPDTGGYQSAKSLRIGSVESIKSLKAMLNEHF